MADKLTGYNSCAVNKTSRFQPLGLFPECQNILERENEPADIYGDKVKKKRKIKQVFKEIFGRDVQPEDLSQHLLFKTLTLQCRMKHFI